MDVRVITKSVKDIECDALIVGVARTKDGMALSPSARAVDELLGGLLTELGRDGECKGNPGELTTIHTMGKLAAKRVVIVGVGHDNAVNGYATRRASALAARHIQSLGMHEIALTPLWDSSAAATQAEIEGALIGLYTFKKYQQAENTTNGKGITKIQFLTDSPNKNVTEEAIERGMALAEATNFARNLVNEPPNVLTPTELANRASTMARHFGLECEVLGRAEMQELGMGGLLAVAQGSVEPPRFIILRYKGAKQGTEKGMALVGKGITFDSGGISIKPAEGMDAMKGDMAGAAAVISAMQAIAILRPAINVTAFVSTTENMPGGTAYRPGDILRIMNGKTIEIVNTDAEGRLVLADALSYAANEGLSPIIDVATLTGGMVIALGNTMTGFFCNDQQLTNDIIAAGQAAGEKYWPMPLDDDYAEQIKSDVADIKQSGGRPASSVTAAKILQNFVGEAKWAHLDIAGTSYLDNKKPHQEKGATGVAVRTLVELVMRR